MTTKTATIAAARLDGGREERPDLPEEDGQRERDRAARLTLTES